MLKKCGSFPGSNSDGEMPSRGRGKSLSLHLFYDVLQEIRVVVSFKLALTSRSLHLLVGCQLISSISFEMFGCSLYFSRILEFGSPSSVLSDSTFLISSSSACLLLRRVLFFVIQSHTCCSHKQFKYLSSCFPDFLMSLAFTKT